MKRNVRYKVKVPKNEVTQNFLAANRTGRRQRQLLRANEGLTQLTKTEVSRRALGLIREFTRCVTG